MTTKRMILYNNGDVNYQKIKLKANAIDFDWTSFTLTSEGTTDSTGALIGKPIFSDGEKEYRSRKMLYNFKTKKGKVYEVTTQEGDAFLHSAEIKKNEYDEWYGKSTMYTTCDLDHPHFYFKAKKVKVVPNKVLVTGPANLWVGDVPTPLVVPFAFFPVKQGKKSGIIVPQYGQDAVFGFFLRDGGYYWAMNDYVGLKFLGQVGTNGTFGVGTVAQYALRYKFTGNVSFSYLRTRPADPDLPGAKPANAYSFAWTHQQDPKSIPNSTFGANVQVQSRDFLSKQQSH
jgi:lipopolysaccharide assembly outer membrane protein LptD (OstA)